RDARQLDAERGAEDVVDQAAAVEARVGRGAAPAVGRSQQALGAAEQDLDPARRGLGFGGRGGAGLDQLVDVGGAQHAALGGNGSAHQGLAGGAGQELVAGVGGQERRGGGRGSGKEQQAGEEEGEDPRGGVSGCGFGGWIHALFTYPGGTARDGDVETALGG